MNEDEDMFIRSLFIGVLMVCSFMFYLMMKNILKLNSTWKRNKDRITNGYSMYDFHKGDPNNDNYDFGQGNDKNITKETMLAYKNRWLSSVRDNLSDVTEFKMKHNLDPTIKTVNDNMDDLYDLPKDATAQDKIERANIIYNTNSKVLDSKYDDYDYSKDKQGDSYWTYLFENSKIRLRPSEQAIYIKNLEDRINALETK